MRDKAISGPLRNKYFRLGAGVLLAAGVGVTALQTTSSFAQEVGSDTVKFEVYVTDLSTVKSVLVTGHNGDAPICTFLDDTADHDYQLHAGTATVNGWSGTNCTGDKVSSDFTFTVNSDCPDSGMSVEIPNNEKKCFRP